MNLRHIFIINSFGSNDNSIIYNQIKKICTNLDINYVIEINNPYVSTEEIINKYKDTENIIFAVGGDGMINKVVNNIVGTNNILGIIPYGTGNDFQKTINETLDDGITNIDVAKINDRYFINTACFGIDADIANDEEIIHNKYIPKSQRYNTSVIYHFLKYQPRNIEVIINDQKINKSYTTVVLANGRYYGGKYKIGTNSSLTDGLLDIYLVDSLPKLKMAKLILGMEKGLHEKSNNVTKISTDSLTVKFNDKFKCNIDGEILEDNVFKVNILPNNIKLYNNQELVKKLIKK